MKPGGGRGGGATLGGVGVDGLVARGIVESTDASRLPGLKNVGRQGDLTRFLRKLLNGAAGWEIETYEELGIVTIDRVRPPRASDTEPSGLDGALGGTEEAPPLEGVGRGTEKEALDLATGGAEATKASMQDADVITQQSGRGREDAGQVGEGCVLDPAGVAPDNEKSGGVATCGGHGRNAVGRQEVIEIRSFHPISHLFAAG